MKKTILILVTAGWLATGCIAQTGNLELSLKIGAAKTFAAPFNIARGYAYRNYSKLYPYPVLGFGLSKNTKESNNRWTVGLCFQPIWYVGGFNTKNIQPGGISRQLAIALYDLQLYGMVEKRLEHHAIQVSRNYFTWVGGIGLNINGPFGRNGYHYISTADFGVTYDGRTITGSELYFKNAPFFIAPSVFTGFRYHIRNKKSAEPLTLELITNYGITRYFDYAIQYEIDGQPAEDRLGEKGFNIQFNVIIPLRNFSKKKRGRN